MQRFASPGRAILSLLDPDLDDTQKLLRKLLSKDLISYLNPSEDKSQFQRDRSFMDGLKQASDVFRSKFQPTARGMRRAQWADDEVNQANAS